MSSIGEGCAYWLLQLVQRTPFRGNHNTFTQVAGSDGKAGQKDEFPQARLEAENFAEFIGFFKELKPEVHGLVVLDLGSGYGGKAVEMARTLRPQKVVGIEPFDKMTAKCRGYAESVGEGTCEFRTCGHREVPAADGEFEAILSHDVIEHVADPRATMSEMARVLKPGGKAYIIFTPYWGALAHHLGYVTRMPFIHWVFRAKALVGAVNRLLSGKAGERFGTVLQPLPMKSYHGRFDVLPNLNGIGGDEFLDLAREHGFEVLHQRYPTIMERFLPHRRSLVGLNAALMRLHPRLKEGLSFNMVCILRKKPTA